MFDNKSDYALNKKDQDSIVYCGSDGYLANIENNGTIPSVPVVIQLISICGLPSDRYFNPAIIRSESELRQRVSHKLKLCPEEYLPIIEGAIDGAISLGEKSDR